jgi:hypothetical protein
MREGAFRIGSGDLGAVARKRRVAVRRAKRTRPERRLEINSSV